MKDYILELRSMVGHMPLLLCSGSVIVIKENRILLQKRRDNGSWSYHGGAAELGETLEETAAREMLEETGLTAKSLKLFGVFSGTEMHYIYPNGDEVYVVDHIYICDDFEGGLCPQLSEILELKWFDIDKLPSDICEPVKKGLYAFADSFKTAGNV